MTVMETADQQSQMDGLAMRWGYLDRHVAASIVLQRSESRVRAGLTRYDADRVIVELDRDDDTGDVDDAEDAAAAHVFTAGGLDRRHVLAGGAVSATAAWLVVTGVLWSVLVTLFVAAVVVISVVAMVSVAVLTAGGGGRPAGRARQLPCGASIWATATRIRGSIGSGRAELEGRES